MTDPRKKLLSLIEPGRRERGRKTLLQDFKQEGPLLTAVAVGTRRNRATPLYQVEVNLRTLVTRCQCYDSKKQMCKHMAAVLMA